jgi:Flp pilus assembly protein CpaB
MASDGNRLSSAMAKAPFNRAIGAWKGDSLAQREFRASRRPGFAAATSGKVPRVATRPGSITSSDLLPGDKKAEKALETSKNE